VQGLVLYDKMSYYMEARNKANQLHDNPQEQLSFVSEGLQMFGRTSIESGPAHFHEGVKKKDKSLPGLYQTSLSYFA